MVMGVQVMGGIATLLVLMGLGVLSGCVAQQADLRQTERSLQQKIKQSNDELLQTRARQNQDLTALREQELPQLRDQLERMERQGRDLQNKQDDLKQRSAVLEQQTKKLEQLAGGMSVANPSRQSVDITAKSPI